MMRARRSQARPRYPLRPGPTRLRRFTWPPLSDTFAFLFSVGSIWYVGAAVARFVEAAR